MPIETDLLQYISDIKQDDSDEDGEYPEIDEEDFESAVVTSGWIKLTTTPTISMTQEAELWKSYKG